MSISLTGPTTAVTSTSGKISAGTFTFVPDMANDNRSKVFVVSALGGTQTGANKHTVDAPKQMIFKRPASYAMPSGYNQVSGRYARVPKNVHRVVFRGSANVASGQTELIPISLDIPVPAGAIAYDQVNVEASIMAFIAGLYDQKEELVQAICDGIY